MPNYLPVRDVWNFEAKLSREPRVWINEAINLRLSCEALLRYDREALDCLFVQHQAPPLPAFFSARVERMLMGFALENLIKAILLQNTGTVDEVFSRAGNLRWGNRAHDLIMLFEKAGIETDDDGKDWLALWSTCTIWAGRYPIPVNENELPRWRVPAASREELLKRRAREIDEALAHGHLPKGELFDLLHAGVGDQEIKYFRDLFAHLKQIAEEMAAKEAPAG